MFRILGVTAIVTILGLNSPANAGEIKGAFLPCGQINDHSWSESGYDGMKLAKEALAAQGITFSFDYTESQQPAQVEAAARDYAARGYNPIVLHCATFRDAAVNAARAFPNTKFMVATAADSTDLPKNFWFYDGAQQEASFVVGYLAGLVSKGHVGAVGAFQFPAMVRQVEGFRLGARYANPKIKSYATYINSWDDAGKAKEAAQAQIDSGADVIFAATDQAARGVFTAAENSGVRAIASYSDQASLAPKTILVSVLYDYPGLVKMMVANAVLDKLVPGKAYQIGIAGGVGELAPNQAVYQALPGEVRKKVAEVFESIKNAKLKVPLLIKADESQTVDLASLSAK
jgi:basic membrane protein A